MLKFFQRIGADAQKHTVEISNIHCDLTTSFPAKDLELVFRRGTVLCRPAQPPAAPLIRATLDSPGYLRTTINSTYPACAGDEVVLPCRGTCEKTPRASRILHRFPSMAFAATLYRNGVGAVLAKPATWELRVHSTIHAGEVASIAEVEFDISIYSGQESQVCNILVQLTLRFVMLLTATKTHKFLCSYFPDDGNPANS
jgi:hypothetical protein